MLISSSPAGIGGGGCSPANKAILADTSGFEARHGFAVYGNGRVVAPAIGPTLGGGLPDNSRALDLLYQLCRSRLNTSLFSQTDTSGAVFDVMHM